MKRLILLVTLYLPSTIGFAQTVADSQRQAIAKYPALAQEGSPMHTRFRALYNDTKQNNPKLLADPTWPLILADRAAKPSLTAEKLLQQADASLRSSEFDSAAEALNLIAANYATSPQSKTVLALRAFVRAKTEMRDGPFTASEAQKIRSSMDAFDRIRTGYKTATPEKQRALEVIFGTEAFRGAAVSLESFAESSANLRTAMDKAVRGR